MTQIRVLSKEEVQMIKVKREEEAEAKKKAAEEAKKKKRLRKRKNGTIGGNTTRTPARRASAIKAACGRRWC